jgi:hypothetical protein
MAMTCSPHCPSRSIKQEMPHHHIEMRIEEAAREARFFSQAEK